MGTTSLESRTYSGGDLDASFPWLKNVTTADRGKLYFRWSTSEPDITSAQWQITDSVGGFSGSPNIILSGERTDTPSPGQTREFTIELKQFFPPVPPPQPKSFYIRIVPRKSNRALTPSSGVKVTYVKPVSTEIKEFSVERFEQKLKAQLEGKTIGYAYAIYELTTLRKAGAGGWAVVPDVPHSPDRRTTMLSMSKTITAVAVMKAMEEMRTKGEAITIDSHIHPYLPSNWKRGPLVEQVTFKHLLTHKSGLRGTGPKSDPDTYLQLKRTIEAGAVNGFGNPFYDNANFCLFRIIISYMVANREGLNAFASNSDFMARHTGVTYVSYVQKHILEPIDLAGVSVVPTGPVPYTRYYKFNSIAVSSTDPLDDTAILRTGAGYWHMSAKEFGRFIASIRYRPGRIISPESFKLMMDNQLGMYEAPNPADQARHWDHNGRAIDGAGAGSESDWMIFSNGITAVITMNSVGGLGKAPPDIVRDAFNEAW